MTDDAAEWESDHQTAALQSVGLADEYPYGCDSILHVAQALIDARADLAKLRAFAEWCMLEGCWKGMDIDGGDAQDKAIELGLVEPVTVDGPCGVERWSVVGPETRSCACAEWADEWPVTCYRLSRIVTGSKP
jgi:hypothetical protein